MKFSLDQRRVAYDIVDIGLEVSTVFLGMDHNPFGDVPVLFETLIIGEDYDGYTARYTTWEEAEAGHKDVVNMLLGIKTA
jgi:hypothetical protein